jgi:hypothetical protein
LEIIVHRANIHSYKYIASLTDLLMEGLEEGRENLRQLVTELVELSQDQMWTCLVNKYPNILCQPYLDL